MQNRNKIYSFQLVDSDILRDLLEIWMNIEESIRICKLTNEKYKIIKTSDEIKTKINLNLEL